MAATTAPAPPGPVSTDPGPGLLERRVATIERHAVVVLCALLVASGALLMYAGRGLSFFYDEWEWILHDYGGGIHWMLLAHVGNISFWPAAIYKVWFHLIGLNHYAVFRLEVVLAHLACGACVYVMAARRIPRLPALLAATLILFMAATWEDLLWGFQIGYMLSVASGLLVLVLLDSRTRPARDLAAMACLVVSAGSSSLGIPIMVGVLVELIRTRYGRRRLWIVLVPAAMYVLWYLTYGVSQVTEESLIHAPGFAEDLAAAAFGGLAGRGLEWGRPLAVIGFAVLLYCLVRRPVLSARLGGLLAAALTLWVVIGVARSTISIPEESRYIYLGAVLVVLIGVELMRGVSIAPRVSVLAATAVGICVITGLTFLHIGSTRLRTTSATVTAELGALEVAAAYAPAEYRPDPVRAPPVYAGLYLHTVKSIGSSPADTPTEIVAAEPYARAAADTVLMALEPPRLQPTKPSALLSLVPPPPISSLSSATELRRATECVRLTPLPRELMSITFALPVDGLLVHNEGGAVAALAARRFGEVYNPLAGSVTAHSENILSPQADQAPQIPWNLRLTSTSPVSLCGIQ